MTFTPFTFSPQPLQAPFPFLNFTVIPFVQPVSGDNRNYSFEITSISESYQPLILTGNGYILAFDHSIFGTSFSYSPATWTLESLGFNGELITFGASINSVPEPSAFSFLLIGGLLLGGRMLLKTQPV